jgi:hypothetical protein
MIGNTFYVDDGSKHVSQARVLLSRVNINGAMFEVASIGSFSTPFEHSHGDLSTIIIRGLYIIIRSLISTFYLFLET